MASFTAAWRRRVTNELVRLANDGFVVANADDPTSSEFSMNEFSVAFHGPPDTPYEGGVWYVRFTLGADFPAKSPSVGFMQPVWHPNVEFARGAICLDALNDAWTPLQTLSHVLSAVLPVFLAHPNPLSPLNANAAVQLRRQAAAREPAESAHTSDAARNEFDREARLRAVQYAYSHRDRAPPLDETASGAGGAGAAPRRRSERSLRPRRHSSDDDDE